MDFEVHFSTLKNYWKLQLLQRYCNTQILLKSFSIPLQNLMFYMNFPIYVT